MEQETKTSKKRIVEKVIFLIIGVVLFLLLFDYSQELNYQEPVTIVKLIVIAVYLLFGEKLIRFVLGKGRN